MQSNIRRRTFISLLAGAVTTWPSVASAQQLNRIPRVGILWHAGSAEEEAVYLGAIREGFTELGYVEGKNIVLENRFPNEIYDRFFVLADELAQTKVDVLVAVTRPAAIAAKRATTTIPIVFVAVPDPIAAKIVDSLAKPGGNITGLSNMALELNAKRIEFLKEAVPSLTRIGVIINTIDPEAVRPHLIESERAASLLGLALWPISIRTVDEIDKAFEIIDREKLQGAVVTIDGLFYANRKKLADLALARKIPLMVYSRETLEAGALLAYGANQVKMFRYAAAVIDKILKGAKPADMPIEQPTEFQFLINAQTAKALGITVPQALALRANEIVD